VSTDDEASDDEDAFKVYECRGLAPVSNAQNPLHMFPRNFPVDGEADNLLQTC